MNQQKEPAFLVDFMLGKLARWLRIFGYDAKYAREGAKDTPQNKAALVLDSLRENRIVLTASRALSEKKAWKLILIESGDIAGQLKQAAAEAGIRFSVKKLFTRCAVCNSPIEEVKDKEEVRALVPEYVFKTQDVFSRCTGCKKIYWKGTHWDLLLKDLQKAGIKTEP
jgi:uncharacterized protein